MTSSNLLFWFVIRPLADKGSLWVDNRSPNFVRSFETLEFIFVFSASALVVVIITLSIKEAANSRFRFFNLAAKLKPDIRWLYLWLPSVIATCLYFLYPYVSHPNFAKSVAPLPLFDLITIRVSLILLFIAIGGVAYLLKAHNKMLYGLSEIVIAISSNFALIARIDPGQIRRYLFTPNEFIVIAAFIYLLSRGIANFIDGLSDRRSASRISKELISAQDSEDKVALTNQL